MIYPSIIIYYTIIYIYISLVDCPLACFVDLQLTPASPNPARPLMKRCRKQKFQLCSKVPKNLESPESPKRPFFFQEDVKIPEEWCSKPAGISEPRFADVHRIVDSAMWRLWFIHGILGSYTKIAWIYGCLSYSHSILVKCLKPTSKDK